MVAGGLGLRQRSGKDVLGTTWMFAAGSTHGFIPESIGGQGGWQLRGPAPDWSLGDERTPTWRFGAQPAAGGTAVRTSVSAAQFPGIIRLNGEATAPGSDAPANLTVDAAFVAQSVLLLRLTLSNPDMQRALAVRYSIGASASSWTTVQTGFAAFPMNAAAQDTPCFAGEQYQHGKVYFVNEALITDGTSNFTAQAVSWSFNISAGSFEALSDPVDIAPGGEAIVFAAISTVATFDPTVLVSLGSAAAAAEAFGQVEDRWNRYVSVVTNPQGSQGVAPDEQWVAVKAVQTLIHNWRFVPGSPDGVLPSYTGYENGFWSWDTYKQAVGMVAWEPELAKTQLRLLVGAMDKMTGHIPDKVDRCGSGGGCSGKPPLLSWAVWEVYASTNDVQFLNEMRPAMEAFHKFWYAHRDVGGAGMCSWTEGMESGMDDGVRFMPQYAQSVSNSTSQVTTLNFWSIDLNAYLYREKRVLSDVARAVGDAAAADRWAHEADELLPRLQQTFYQPGPSPTNGFFQDRYLNGTILPVQGCEGYAALFCKVATQSQAEAVAVTLSDPAAFLLNFSLPTVSKKDKDYNGKGYWKGPAWLDQTWFAYKGLMLYSQTAPALADLAHQIRSHVFAKGKGFHAKDTTPLNEHYDPDTGEPLGATHFSWSAAHSLLWVLEDAPQPAMLLQI